MPAAATPAGLRLFTAPVGPQLVLPCGFFPVLQRLDGLPRPSLHVLRNAAVGSSAAQPDYRQRQLQPFATVQDTGSPSTCWFNAHTAIDACRGQPAGVVHTLPPRILYGCPTGLYTDCPCSCYLGYQRLRSTADAVVTRFVHYAATRFAWIGAVSGWFTVLAHAVLRLHGCGCCRLICCLPFYQRPFDFHHHHGYGFALHRVRFTHCQHYATTV